MGTHIIAGGFNGLGKQKEPPIRIRISGSLGRFKNAEFRKKLVKLAKDFKLVVKPPLVDAKKKKHK